jgi:hypothetical protein
MEETTIYKAPGLNIWSDGRELKVRIGEHFSAFHLDGHGTGSAIRSLDRVIADLQAAQGALAEFLGGQQP